MYKLFGVLFPTAQLDEVIELYRQEAAIFQNSLGDINTNK